MPSKLIFTDTYLHPKMRAARVRVALADRNPHAIPRIAKANEAWSTDERTVEVELETDEGQLVIVPLGEVAITSLIQLLGQTLKRDMHDTIGMRSAS